MTGGHDHRQAIWPEDEDLNRLVVQRLTASDAEGLVGLHERDALLASPRNRPSHQSTSSPHFAPKTWH